MNMTQSTLCLHNWVRKNSEDDSYLPSSLLDTETVDGLLIPGSWRTITQNPSFTDVSKCNTNNSTREVIRIREHFCEYFNNKGAVPWQ